MLAQAEVWFERHVHRVLESVKQETHEVSPSGSDCNRPELWKGCHWKWFLKLRNS
jgi:hypothetical protein